MGRGGSARISDIIQLIPHTSYKLLGIWLMQAQEKGNQGDACMEVDVQ